MQRYRLFHPLILSFYSRSLYRDVGRNWKGMGFVYLLLLLAVCWFPAMVRMHLGLSSFIKSEAPGFLKQIPQITITNGEVSTDAQTPYFIRNPQNNKELAIIDLTGTYTSLDELETPILLTKSKLFLKRSTTETRIMNLASVKKFSLNQDRLTRWLRLLGTWFAPLAFPFAVAFGFVYRVIQVLIYGGIGLLLAKMLKVQLTYATLVRLAVIAITPVVILSTVIDLLRLALPLFSLICFVIAMGYLFFAVKANSEEETPVPV